MRGRYPDQISVELRDSSPNARAELEALVRRYGGDPGGTGDKLLARALTFKAADSLQAALENDPRVISNEERAVAAAQKRLAEHQAQVDAAQRADGVAQLEAQVAAQAARIAELEVK
jgi:hypothetical protein